MASFFFGIALLLRCLTSDPVERIRITMTAFCAILLLFVVAAVPFLPRWSIALWHETPAVPLEQPLAEMTFMSDFALVAQVPVMWYIMRFDWSIN